MQDFSTLVETGFKDDRGVPNCLTNHDLHPHNPLMVKLVKQLCFFVNHVGTMLFDLHVSSVSCVCFCHVSISNTPPQWLTNGSKKMMVFPDDPASFWGAAIFQGPLSSSVLVHYDIPFTSCLWLIDIGDLIWTISSGEVNECRKKQHGLSLPTR